MENVWIDLPVPTALAKSIICERPDRLHVTLRYFGPADTISEAMMHRFHRTMYNISKATAPVKARLAGAGRFWTPDPVNRPPLRPLEDPLVILVDSPALTVLRGIVDCMLDDIAPPAEHGLVPHITTGRLPASEEARLRHCEPTAFAFDRIVLHQGKTEWSFPLAGK